jgi:hypothetical protein
MLDHAKAIHHTGKDHQGKGWVGELPITVNPGGVVETALGPAGGHTPLEALLHETELVADLFARQGYDTTDVEIAYDVILAMVKIRKHANAQH